MSKQAQSVVRWINENESVDRLKAEHGSIENYALVVWYMTPRLAAQIHEHVEGASR